MDTLNYQAEQQQIAAEQRAEVIELMGEEDDEVVDLPYCGYCGTTLDENGNCPADSESK
jgi:hypothetical protein